jgi:hypothetical protein
MTWWSLTTIESELIGEYRSEVLAVSTLITANTKAKKEAKKPQALFVHYVPSCEFIGFFKGLIRRRPPGYGATSPPSLGLRWTSRRGFCHGRTL